MKRLMKAAQSQQSYVVEIRREFHRHPETRYETDLTRLNILNEVSSSDALNHGNVVIQPPRELRGGIIVDIDIKGSHDRLLFRADFDALPVPENTGLEYSSQTEGISHACGHDTHTAMLLGFLRCLSEGRVVPIHHLRLVFQDAEENPGAPPEPLSGGDLLVKEGVLEGVSSAYALHLGAGEKGTHGVFLSRAGAMLGNSGRVRFLFTASGGHAGEPSLGVNALRVAHAVMSRLDTFAARYFRPTDPVALEPVILNAGKGSNIMPAQAELWYGFRTLLPRKRHLEMTGKLIAEVKAVADSLETELEVMPLYGHPTLINDPEIFSRVSALLSRNGQEVREIPPLLGSEDFAHYLYGVPGAMFLLDAYQPGSGGQHSPTFNPDEDVFWKGVLFWALLATN